MLAALFWQKKARQPKLSRSLSQYSQANRMPVRCGYSRPTAFAPNFACFFREAFRLQLLNHVFVSVGGRVHVLLCHFLSLFIPVSAAVVSRIGGNVGGVSVVFQLFDQPFAGKWQGVHILVGLVQCFCWFSVAAAVCDPL